MKRASLRRVAAAGAGLACLVATGGAPRAQDAGSPPPALPPPLLLPAAQPLPLPPLLLPPPAPPRARLSFATLGRR
jgi:hypothetical protein